MFLSQSRKSSAFLAASFLTYKIEGGIVIRLIKRLFGIVFILVLILWSKPLWGPALQDKIPTQARGMIDSLETLVTRAIPEELEITSLLAKWENFVVEIEDPEQETADEIELEAPEEQSVSVGNVELGDTKDDVEETYGNPEAESESEYGINWSAYHENYHNFMMVAFDDEGIVQGLFTNQDLLSSEFNISLGDKKEKVNDKLGEPKDVIRNGWLNYRVNSDGEYDVYDFDGNMVTFFYDIHDEDKVTAVQIISDQLESSRETFYTASSEELQKGFEKQLFDLTNAARVKHDLPVLDWNEAVSDTARKHSKDMAENQFFSHTNLAGKSAADRMRDDQISFTSAGENLAYGQSSSIFAHQGLMNSRGHRENILQHSYTELGTGIAFGDDNQPFYTENFLKR